MKAPQHFGRPIGWELAERLNTELRTVVDPVYNPLARPDDPDPIDVALQLVYSSEDELVDLAHEARSYSRHYGTTFFGAAALALCQTKGGLFYLRPFAAHNDSPYEGADKSCAEMTVDAETLWHEFAHQSGTMVLSMAIYGPDDENILRKILGTSGHKQCPPCHDCMDGLSLNEAIMPDTRLVLANKLGRRVVPFCVAQAEVREAPRPQLTKHLLAQAQERRNRGRLVAA